ncbi:glycoside hydrolase superfamily [Haematococcus lacustris]
MQRKLATGLLHASQRNIICTSAFKFATIDRQSVSSTPFTSSEHPQLAGAVMCSCRSMPRVLLLLAVAALLFADAQAKKKRKGVKIRRELVMESGPTSEQIWDSGLMEKTLTASSFYEKSRQYYENVDVRRQANTVLAYVTPWNREGYDNAVRFRAKLTHVSPVWYTLKRVPDTTADWVLEGGHEYNQSWVQAVRQPVGQSGHQVKVVPRFMVEVSDPNDNMALIMQSMQPLRLMWNEVKDKDYDGLVLEVMQNWLAINILSAEHFLEPIYLFMSDLSNMMHNHAGRRREIIMATPPVLPAAHDRLYVDKRTLVDMNGYVDAWSLMTYDYCQGATSPHNSPLPWIDKQFMVLERHAYKGKDNTTFPDPYEPLHKVLVGLNWYGYDHNTAKGTKKPVTMQAVLQLMAQHTPDIEWDKEEREHHFQYQAKGVVHEVYFPTPRAMEERLELVAKAGGGVAIWELGQGVERFFDLL